MTDERLTDQQIGEMKREFGTAAEVDLSASFYRLIDEVRAYRDEVKRLRLALEGAQLDTARLDKMQAFVQSGMKAGLITSLVPNDDPSGLREAIDSMEAK